MTAKPSRRPLVAAALVLLALLVPGVPARASTTTSLDGTAMIHFGGGKGASYTAPHHGLTDPACDPGSFCGSGSFRELGAALVYLDGDSYGPPVSPKCLAFEKDGLIAAKDGTWGIALHGTGTVCFPDETHQSPPFTDFGNPGVYDVDVEVIDSWGIYAGASGSGHETFKVAGDEGLWRFQGTVTTG
jgi:hypothetical protein